MEPRLNSRVMSTSSCCFHGSVRWSRSVQLWVEQVVSCPGTPRPTLRDYWPPHLIAQMCDTYRVNYLEIDWPNSGQLYAVGSIIRWKSVTASW